MRLISTKNYTRLASQLCDARADAGIKYSDNPKPGCYNVCIKNRKTGEACMTQGDIPFKGPYGWKEFLEWLVDDIMEIDMGDDNDIDIVSIEYAGTENACEENETIL